MNTPADAGWGSPHSLDYADMVRCEIWPGHAITVRNADVGAVFCALIGRLRAAGWDGPDPQPDEWGYTKRLKRWAQGAGQTMAGAPLSSWSDHAWGTAVDLDTARNPMLARRPANPQAHSTLPLAACPAIAADLGLEWGGAWTEPWDPQHWQVAVSPARLHVIAAGLTRLPDLTTAVPTPAPEDDVSKQDVLAAMRELGVTQTDIVAAIAALFHLPKSGLAPAAGQVDNGSLAAILVGAGQHAYNRDRAAAGQAATAAGQISDLAGRPHLDPDDIADRVLSRWADGGKNPGTLTRADVRETLREVLAAALAGVTPPKT